MTPEIRVKIRRLSDVEEARRSARELAVSIGLGAADAEAVALTVSELGTNLLRYAMDGVITVTAIGDATVPTVEVESRDAGPGIADLARALEEGFSTGGGLGSGLPSVRRLMDDLTIKTGPDGTHVVARKCATHL